MSQKSQSPVQSRLQKSSSAINSNDDLKKFQNIIIQQQQEYETLRRVCEYSKKVVSWYEAGQNGPKPSPNARRSASRSDHEESDLEAISGLCLDQDIKISDLERRVDQIEMEKSQMMNRISHEYQEKLREFQMEIEEINRRIPERKDPTKNPEYLRFSCEYRAILDKHNNLASRIEVLIDEKKKLDEALKEKDEKIQNSETALRFQKLEFEGKLRESEEHLRQMSDAKNQLEIEYGTKIEKLATDIFNTTSTLESKIPSLDSANEKINRMTEQIGNLNDQLNTSREQLNTWKDLNTRKNAKIDSLSAENRNLKCELEEIEVQALRNTLPKETVDAMLVQVRDNLDKIFEAVLKSRKSEHS